MATIKNKPEQIKFLNSITSAITEHDYFNDNYWAISFKDINTVIFSVKEDKEMDVPDFKITIEIPKNL